MIWSLRSLHTVFALAAGFLAATIGDAVVESVSNSGLLWRGHFTDGSSLDLLPMFLLSSATCAAMLALIVRDRMLRSRSSFRALLCAASRALPARSVGRLVPAIFVLQLATLFVMETLEQIATYGHPLGGTVWLGAPTITSLAMHGAFAAIVAFSLSSALTSAADRVVRVVHRLHGRLLEAGRTAAAVTLRGRIVCGSDRLLRVARLAERGPPASAVPV